MGEVTTAIDNQSVSIQSLEALLGYIQGAMPHELGDISQHLQEILSHLNSFVKSTNYILEGTSAVITESNQLMDVETMQTTQIPKTFV